MGISRSTLLPELNLSMEMNRSKQESNRIQGSQEESNYFYGISGKQLLFDGGKAVFQTHGAKKVVMQNIYDNMSVSAEVRLNLRTAFVNLMQAQDAVRISKEILERRKKNLQLVRMRYDAGREHKGSLLTAEVSLAQAVSDLTQAKRKAILAQHQLAQEMGLKEWKVFSVKETPALPKIDDVTPIFYKLADSTPQVKKAVLQVEYAKYNKKAARADYSPEIYGVGSAGKSGTTWLPENTQWSVGVEITLPLLQGGKRIYTNSKYESEYRQAIADEKSIRSKVIVELEEKWIALQYALDTLQVKQKNLKAAEERARIAEAQYSIGQILFDNWIIIENALVDAKKSFLQARTDMYTAEAEWNYSKGVTLKQ